MLFNSLEYILFLPLVVLLYFVTPSRMRWLLLLIASYFFYMTWRPEYAFLILLSTGIDYIVALQLDKTTNEKTRKLLLYLSLLGNLGMLITFKYLGFFNEVTRDLLNLIDINYPVQSFSILLPVGISFYTFQSLSYTIDVYRKTRPAEKHFGIFALYVSFFPQLIAGPIERSTHLLPQFRVKHRFDWDNIITGGKRIVWGLFKKVVLADQLGILVNAVNDNPENYSSFTILLSVFAFAIQIYMDFSAYSDIAIGSAKMMGFNLLENFKQPYFTKNIADYWRRWHISLFNWIKEYFYTPLLRKTNQSKLKQYFNAFTVFTIVGLWHGAAWTYIIWGICHSIFIISYRLTSPLRKRINAFADKTKLTSVINFLAIVRTFIITSLLFIIFRADSLEKSWYIFSQCFSFNYIPSHFNSIYSGTNILTLLISLILVFLLELQNSKKLASMPVDNIPFAWIRWGMYVGITFIIGFSLNPNKAEFIYFQF